MLATLIRKLFARITTDPEQPLLSKNVLEQLQQAGERYEAGDIAAARTLYEQVLRSDRDHPEAQYYLGVILGRAGDYSAAAELLGKVIEKQPQFADALNSLGNVMRLQGRPQDAADYYRRALAINADLAPVWTNLALCLRDVDHCTEAMEVLQRALAISPKYSDALVNLAMLWDDLGDVEQAHTLLLRVLDLDPNIAEAHVHLAQILLRRGDYAAGWREYDWRLRMDEWELLPKYSCPVWQGQEIVGKNLLVTAEQGLGDQIMFASCLNETLRRVEHCIVESHPPLTALFARSFPEAAISAVRVVNPVVGDDAINIPDL